MKTIIDPRSVFPRSANFYVLSRAIACTRSCLIRRCIMSDSYADRILTKRIDHILYGLQENREGKRKVRQLSCSSKVFFCQLALDSSGKHDRVRYSVPANGGRPTGDRGCAVLPESGGGLRAAFAVTLRVCVQHNQQLARAMYLRS